MNKRKLTKVIRKRRLKYKPTIGITLKSGERLSVNAVEYRIAVEKEEKAKADAEMRRIAYKVIRDVCPGMAFIKDMLGAWSYYF